MWLSNKVIKLHSNNKIINLNYEINSCFNNDKHKLEIYHKRLGISKFFQT